MSPDISMKTPHPKYSTELELSSYSMVSAWVSNIIKTYSYHGSHQTCFIQYHVGPSRVLVVIGFGSSFGSTRLQNS